MLYVGHPDTNSIPSATTRQPCQALARRSAALGVAVAVAYALGRAREAQARLVSYKALRLPPRWAMKTWKSRCGVAGLGRKG